MNTIDEAIEILKAMKEGKKIQVYMGSEWQNSTLETGVPNFFQLTYRIKPEPREIWVNMYDPDDGHFAYSSKDQALAGRGSNAKETAVRFREVIEE